MRDFPSNSTEFDGVRFSKPVSACQLNRTKAPNCASTAPAVHAVCGKIGSGELGPHPTFHAASVGDGGELDRLFGRRLDARRLHRRFWVEAQDISKAVEE